MLIITIRKPKSQQNYRIFTRSTAFRDIMYVKMHKGYICCFFVIYAQMPAEIFGVYFPIKTFSLMRI